MGDLQTQAWVLHRKPYRDTSLLIDVLTAEHGRLALVGRGARRARKRDPVEPLALYDIAFALGRGASDLGSLRSAERVASPELRGEAGLCGLYVSELVLRLLSRNDPAHGVFAAYSACLGALADSAPGRAADTLRAFELALLGELGYAPDLHSDANGRPLAATGRYRWLHEHGFVPVSGAADGVSGDALQALAAQQWAGDAQRHDARRALRAVMQPLLGDKPLQTPALLRQLRALDSGSQDLKR